jgi:hypothetical protein
MNSELSDDFDTFPVFMDAVGAIGLTNEPIAIC